MKILATLLAAALCASAMAQTAGTMDFVQGSATVVGVDGARRPARTGATLAVGETVETGTDGEVHAVMADGGMLVASRLEDTAQLYRLRTPLGALELLERANDQVLSAQAQS